MFHYGILHYVSYNLDLFTAILSAIQLKNSQYGRFCKYFPDNQLFNIWLIRCVSKLFQDVVITQVNTKTCLYQEALDVLRNVFSVTILVYILMYHACVELMETII